MIVAARAPQTADPTSLRVAITPEAMPWQVDPRVHAVAARWSLSDLPPTTLVEAPASPRAVPARSAEQIAGRWCAAQALVRAGSEVTAVPARADRAPVWPDGFVGSITHVRGWAAAAVARQTELRAVGIDAEDLVTDDAMGDLRQLVASPGELQVVAAMEPRVALTLIFVAKEAFYKCLFPLCGVVFDFPDVRLVRAEAGGAMTLDLVSAVGAFAPGFRVEGRFAIVGQRAYASAVLPR